MPEENNASHFAKKYFEEIDEVSEASNYFLPILQEVGMHINFSAAKILDVGCGTGIFLKPIVEAGCTELYGIDGPSEFASRAIERGYKEVQFVPDLNKSPLPYPDETFDLVICKDVFEHLLNPLFCLSEIKRVLKSGGLFLFHVPNHFPLYGRIKFVFTNDIDPFSFFKNESRWTFPHIRFYEHDDSQKMMADNELELVSDLSYHFQAIPLLSRFQFLSSFRRTLVGHFPNQFAAGFTYLEKKK